MAEPLAPRAGKARGRKGPLPAWWIGGLALLTLACAVALSPSAAADEMLRLNVSSENITAAVGHDFTIDGVVLLEDSNGTQRPAEGVLVFATFVNPPQPDMPPSARTEPSGAFTIYVSGRSTAKVYWIRLVAQDPSTANVSNERHVFARVESPPQPPPEVPQVVRDSGWITATLLLAAAGTAGGLALSVVRARRKPPHT